MSGFEFRITSHYMARSIRITGVERAWRHAADILRAADLLLFCLGPNGRCQTTGVRDSGVLKVNRKVQEPNRTAETEPNRCSEPLGTAP